MKLLLDECVDRRLARKLTGHSVRSVQQMGWSGIKNGRLLSLAQHRFDVFVTVDHGVHYQQSVADLGIAVLVLIGSSSRLGDLELLVPDILAVLPTLCPGTIAVLERSESDPIEPPLESQPKPNPSSSEPTP